jgi:hypothetical protein
MTGPLKNARHERFAQELAKGLPASKAYVAAGYRPSEPNSSRLTRNEQVSARVAELKGMAADKVVVTVAGLTERLLKIAAAGDGKTEAPLLSVSRAALMDVAKLNGLIVDRSRIGFDFSNCTDDELETLERILARTPQPR